MKTLRTAIIMMALMAGLSMTVHADTAKQKLINSMYKEQRTSETQLINLWLANKRGAELDKVLSDYVVREVRLQAMTGSMNTRSLLSKVKHRNSVSFKNTKALAQLLVLEHFKAQGIDFSDTCFVQGKYLIRKGCIKNDQNQSAYNWE